MRQSRVGKLLWLGAALLVPLGSSTPAIGGQLVAQAAELPEAPAKRRLLVLTDIGGDPDDRQSMVRLMTYANHFDIEGLVATRNSGGIFPQQIRDIVGAYAKVRDNLLLHESGYPKAESLAAVIAQGPQVDGQRGVGTGFDSTGSELLIRAVDRPDPRPLWVTV